MFLEAQGERAQGAARVLGDLLAGLCRDVEAAKALRDDVDLLKAAHLQRVAHDAHRLSSHEARVGVLESPAKPGLYGVLEQERSEASDPLKRLGIRLRRRRMVKGLSPTQVANGVPISPTVYRLLEAGEWDSIVGRPAADVYLEALDYVEMQPEGVF